MPATFKYRFNFELEVAMSDETEITATKAKAQNFVDNQISLGRVSEHSRAEHFYTNKPGRAHPHVLKSMIKLYISDLSVVEPLGNILSGALDTFDEVLNYRLYLSQELETWTAPTQ